MITATVADAKMILGEAVRAGDFITITVDDTDLVSAALAACHPADQERMSRPVLLRACRVLHGFYALAMQAHADREHVDSEDSEPRLKRYWLFAGCNHYPCGSLSDLKGTFSNADDALIVARRPEIPFDWWNIFDSVEHTIVAAKTDQQLVCEHECLTRILEAGE